MNAVGALMGVIGQTQAITEHGQRIASSQLAMLARLRGENQALKANARENHKFHLRLGEVRPSLIQF